MENEVKETLEDLKSVIYEVLDDEWVTQCDQYEFQYGEDSERYGDTWVSTGSYITDESEAAFRKEFKAENDVDEFINKLKASNDFREVLKKLVEQYAYTKELEV